MGRWTQYDEDEHRLPQGMTRIAYDADTGKYTFKDANGALYEGPQFGEMHPVGTKAQGGRKTPVRRWTTTNMTPEVAKWLDTPPAVAPSYGLAISEEPASIIQERPAPAYTEKEKKLLPALPASSDTE